ncbi:KR domain-containing protein [Chaetomium fimeti]|uniref:KR domain-containing protein n=1 Tax=Chaetomium fimeti TaxID=1854472 RepID=A0AAE0H9F5_9PEZI|nr:KR domain-containing protein [Chaetomium fimeti]
MPPIGGVANGAMVLRDISVVQMSFEALSTVLRSKIQSTTNLDRLFSPSSPSSKTLDWFIGFSSIVGTTGNPGQAAYSAGNVFIKTLIRRRRARGLPGSTIDICRVLGVGYVEREQSAAGRLTREQQARLATRSGSLAMSEADLHQLFAEAVVSGRPASGLDPELISGMAPITTDQAKDAFWAINPKFGLLIREKDAAAAGRDRAGGGKGGGVPLRQLLEAAKTMEDVSVILTGALKTKLQALMFLPEGDPLSETTPLVDMGVDSLVGVEMRSWFLQELGVDVPVMKILGGASISDLAEGVMQNLPSEIKSRIEGGDDTAKDTEKDTAKEPAGELVTQPSTA